MNAEFQNISFDQLVALLGIQDDDLVARISDQLFSELWGPGLVHGILHPEKIMAEINRLEGRGSTPTKPADEFRGSILAGFWKKHFFQSQFMGRNLISEMRLESSKSKKFEQMVRRIENETKDLHERSARIADEFVRGSFEARNRKQSMTGEWIVFGRAFGKNFYLTLASHEEGDASIYRRVRAACEKHYLFLLPSDDAFRLELVAKEEMNGSVS